MNEQFNRLRGRFIDWLESADESNETSIEWICGRRFPAVGEASPVWDWVERFLMQVPSGRRRLEKKLATRLRQVVEALAQPAFLAARHPAVVEDFQYNLFHLCRVVAAGEDLFAPLHSVFERAQSSPNCLASDLVRNSFREALVANQMDSTLWKLWEQMLLGARHPVLLGRPLDGFHATRLMPPASNRLGQPAYQELAIALKHLANLKTREQASDDEFIRVLSVARNTYPDRVDWDYQLLTHAWRVGWPHWALELIASHDAVFPPPGEAAIPFFVSYVLLDMSTRDEADYESPALAPDASSFTNHTETQDRIRIRDGIIHSLERCCERARATNCRSVLGVISHELQSVAQPFEGSDRRGNETAEFRRAMLLARNGIPVRCEPLAGQVTQAS